MRWYRCLEGVREKARQGQQFSDQFFLPYFPCRHPTILHQNKNEIF